MTRKYLQFIDVQTLNTNKLVNSSSDLVKHTYTNIQLALSHYRFFVLAKMAQKMMSNKMQS